MSFVFYAVLMIVSLSSVVFGLEWLAEAPPVWKQVAVASIQQPAKRTTAKQATRQPVAAAKAANSGSKVTTAQAGTTQMQASPPRAGRASADAKQTAMAMASTTPDDNLGAPNDTMATEVGDAGAEVAPKCDIQACEAAYRSFRASDCTWQPYEGPRRFCDKGTPPQAVGQAGGAEPEPQTQASRCNIQACSAAYFSFDPADCTYQPYNGPRRLCTK